jgi:hypothetical protein
MENIFKDPLNDLITLLRFEEDRVDRYIALATRLQGSDSAKSQQYREKAFKCEQKLAMYEMLYEEMSRKAVLQFGTVVGSMVITTATGIKATKPANEPVEAVILGPEAPKIIETIKQNEGFFTDSMAKRNVFSAYIHGGVTGVKDAQDKVRYFFKEEVEKYRNLIIKREEESRGKNYQGLESIQSIVERDTNRYVKEFTNSIIREEEIKVRTEAKEEILKEASASRNTKVMSPEDIFKVQYWKNDEFNHLVLVGDVKNHENMVKVKAIQLYMTDQKEQAVGIIRSYYAEKNWDNSKAELFLLELLKNANMDPLKELKEALTSFIIRGLETDIKAKNPKEKDRNFKSGISQAKKFAQAYFRTSEKDATGKFIIAWSDEKIDKLVNKCIINAQSEFRELNRAAA